MKPSLMLIDYHDTLHKKPIANAYDKSSIS